MKANYKKKTFETCKPEHISFTRIKLCIDNGKFYLIPLDGIYGISLERVDTDVADGIRPLLKQDLIEGNDRFLVATYDHTDKGFCFEMFMYNIEFDLDFFLKSEYKLAKALIDANIQTPRIITFK